MGKSGQGRDVGLGVRSVVKPSVDRNKSYLCIVLEFHSLPLFFISCSAEGR